MLTRAELEFMSRVPALLSEINKNLQRIADSLETISNNLKINDNESNKRH